MKSQERCWQCKREESNKKKKQEIKYALGTLITFLDVVNVKKKNKSNLSDIWRQLDTMHTSFCCFFANFTIFRTREVDICTKRFVLLNFILLILFSCFFFFFFNDIFEDSTDIATRLNGNTGIKKKERKYIIGSLQIVSNVFTIANRNKSSLMIQSTTTVNYENVFTFFFTRFYICVK